MKEKIIGLKELRENIAKYAKELQPGQPIIVVKRSKPLFKLTHVDDDDDESNWETLIDFRAIPGYENGIDAEELLMRLRQIDKTPKTESNKEPVSYGQNRKDPQKVKRS